MLRQGRGNLHCGWPTGGVGCPSGVGVAPSIPTLGDRRRSEHNIIGLTVFDHPALHAEAIGGCRSRPLAGLAGRLRLAGFVSAVVGGELVDQAGDDADLFGGQFL